MDKIIEQNDGNKIIISEDKENYCGYYFLARKDYFKNGIFEKSIDFSMWDDFGLYGWIDDVTVKELRNMNQLDFNFDKNDDLYIPLMHLLNGDKKILIDDDNTESLNKKYMLISKDEDDIVVSFINDDRISIDKFQVFIKNIALDYRSKIDAQGLDTKARLLNFFKEMQTLLYEEHHQITFEEYLLRKDIYDKPKVFKKI